MNIKEEYEVSCRMSIQCTLCGFGEMVDGKRESNRIMKEHFIEKHGMKR